MQRKVTAVTTSKTITINNEHIITAVLPSFNVLVLVPSVVSSWGWSVVSSGSSISTNSAL